MSRDGRASDRLLEVIAVLLLGVATVGTAWCGLQSSLWNGEQQELSVSAASQRIESSRLFGLAAQSLAYDSNTIIGYADAVLAGDQAKQAFLRQTVMRPELLPFLDKWRAQIRAGGQKPNLLTDQAYLDSLQSGYKKADQQADATSAAASEAGRVGDMYTLTTVLLAIALFFAGVTASFRYPLVRMALLTGSVAAIAVAAVRVIDLPLAAATADLIPWS